MTEAIVNSDSTHCQNLKLSNEKIMTIVIIIALWRHNLIFLSKIDVIL